MVDRILVAAPGGGSGRYGWWQEIHSEIYMRQAIDQPVWNPERVSEAWKLLIFVHSLSAGGAERVAAYLANTFLARGVQVVLLTMAGQDTDYYPLHPGVVRDSLNLAGESGSPIGALSNNVRRLLSLRRALRRHRSDLALALMSTSIVHLSLASVGLRLPIVGAEHSQPSHSPIGACWSKLRVLAYRKVNALVALTPESGEWLARHAGARRISVIPNPVIWPLPVQPPQLSPSDLGTPGRKRMLAVGRLERVKGFDILLKAFAKLASQHPDWELVILGEGTERDGLEVSIRELDLSDRIFLPGRVGNLADWYSRASLFVMTSRHEGFPNVLLEAMAHGMPAVSFDCEAGPRNIIRHEVDGLLVPDQDVFALVATLDRVMADDTLRRSLASHATEVRERFSEARIQTMWLELFQNLLHETRD